MKKTLSIFGLLFLLLLGIAACGTSDQVEDDGNNSETQKAEENETKIDNENEQAVINDLGIYVGQADPHTIEIETNEGPKAFQLTEKSTEQIKALQPDDKVKFQYIVNENKQNVLQSIEKMKGTEGNAEETGIYNGQQDPHTIEIETADGPTAFQLSLEAREQVEQLQEGKKVSYTYRVEGPQLIIESIKQAE